MGAHREAAQQYARALRFADGESPRARAALLDAYALEAQVTGLSAEAADAWLRAASLHRSLGSTHAEGRYDRVADPGMHPDRAQRRGREGERGRDRRPEAEGPEPRQLALAYAAQAYVRMLNRDNADGVAWGTRAAEIAEQVDDLESLAAYALNMIGTSYVMAGEIDTGIDRLLGSLRIARSEPALWIWVGPALSMLGTGLGEMYELEQSEHYLREHLAYADEHDLWPQYTRAWLSLVLAYTGRWDDAAALARDVLVGANDPISRITALITIGRVRARRGDPGAMDALDEALELARSGGHLQRIGHVRVARAEACFLAGDPDGAAEEARAVFDVAVRKRHLWFTGGLRVLAGAGGRARRLARLGRRAVAAAARPLARGRGRVGGAGLPVRGSAGRGGSRDRVRAPRRARRARPARRRPVGPRGASAAARARSQRPPRAASDDPCEPRGADASRARRPAARRGRQAERGHRRRARGVAQDVDHHVSAILRKLGARTRGEAAAAAADRGLLDG